MSDAKLMMPLFCNGMFNCGGRRIRAVHLYDVSDGEHRYRLWTKAGTPDIDYPRVESDRYLLYVEIHGYLAPLGMTEYFLTEHCGYLPAMRELYGGAEHRRTYFDSLQKSAIEEAVAIERTVIYHLGKESPRQADYIHGILNEHLMRYTASKENGGETFPDYIGALMAGELDQCMQLFKTYLEHEQQEDEIRQAQIAEQERALRQAVNAEKETIVAAALQTIRSGGTLRNEPIRYYKDDGTLVETSLILYLMREYHINVPIRTQGWIKERLATANVQEDFCGSVTYYRARKSQCSQKFFDCMRDLITAVHDAKKGAA
mgnify:FL=1